MASREDVFVESEGRAETPGPLVRINDVPAMAWLPKRRGGARIAVATLHRWCSRGVGGVRLRYVRVGGVRCTTEGWLRELFEALASRDNGVRPAAATALIQTETSRQRRAAAAERQLRDEGFKVPTND